MSDVDRPDPWDCLRAATHARVGLGRSGSSMPTQALLQLRADQLHAAAAVHAPFDIDLMTSALRDHGLAYTTVRTRAVDRQDYLKHPDHGRALDDRSREHLNCLANDPPWDVALLISDGLSTEAAVAHAAPVAARTIELLAEQGLSVAPVIIAPNARVGLLNDVGDAIGARVVAILLGERPGLSSADSLGAYVEFSPRPGLTDADRNCISNIRADGLDPEHAGAQLAMVITQALRQELSGTGLKLELAPTRQVSSSAFPARSD